MDNIDDKGGWISLYRKTIDSSVFQNSTIWHVWTWCLLKANHKDRVFMFNGKDMLVKRGQFVTGRDKALTEMPDLSARRYRTAINYLKSTNRITTTTTNRFTIITICKYDEYQNKNLQSDQQKEQEATNKRPTNDQQATINNNVNNENNVNNPLGLASKIVELYFQVDSGSVNTDPEQNLKAATRLLEIFERESPGLGADDTLTAMGQFFEGSVNISDDWLRSRMSLPFIVQKFNVIKKTLIQPSAHGATAPEISPCVTKRTGSDSSPKSVNGDWENYKPKPGTSPDLRNVDTTNYLNEQQ